MLNESIFPKIVCSLSENTYICCRNNNNGHENIYSKYILVVALFTTPQVVRNQSSCIYYKQYKKVCRTYGGPFSVYTGKDSLKGERKTG